MHVHFNTVMSYQLKIKKLTVKEVLAEWLGVMALMRFMGVDDFKNDGGLLALPKGFMRNREELRVEFCNITKLIDNRGRRETYYTIQLMKFSSYLLVIVFLKSSVNCL